jgi:hypothetical protein
MQDFYVLQLKVYDRPKLGSCLRDGNAICSLRIRLKMFGEQQYEKKCEVSLRKESLCPLWKRSGVLNTTFYLGIPASTAGKVRGHEKDSLEQKC